MKFVSTRNAQIKKTLTDAIQIGLAEDGGLFIPEQMPTIDIKTLDPTLPYPEFAHACLQPFFKDDQLEGALAAICKNVFTFPVPLQTINENTFVFELFHGPTLSFKDFGARFLAECLSTLSKKENITIMVATSGDTGSAVASAFYRKPNVNVVILYPKGKISAKQEHQITCFDQNVLAVAVTGTFDDCQQLVKAAFNDTWWQQTMHISSANSINIGRLLPQMTYYAYISLQFYAQHQKSAGFIIPTGNLGHATAAYWAKAMGFPIREIVLATNANAVIPDYLATGQFTPRRSVHTLANAMDVGNPSNFERLVNMYPEFEQFKDHVRAMSVSDDDIKKTIQYYHRDYNTIICPHTATAAFVRQQCSPEPWIIVATADPAKFDDVIEPIIRQKIPISAPLQALLDRPTHSVETPADLNAIQQSAARFFVKL
jgi:threonine synthase